LNRLTGKTYPDGSTATYTYDNASRLTQVTDGTGTYSFTFDSMGRLLGTSTQYTFLPGQTFKNAYAYDEASNRKSLTAPDGGTTVYAYDPLNRLQSLTSSNAGQFGFGYDPLSRRKLLTRPNGVNTAYRYDDLSRLLSLFHQLGGTTIDGAAYTFDAAGNRSGKTNFLDNSTEQYGYDPIYQLIQATRNGATSEQYGYDAVGNRLNSLSATYSYNSSNELIASSDGTTYKYDTNGNMFSKTTTEGTTQYAWDFENRLTAVTLPDGGVVRFQYDPFGRRIKKSSAVGTTIYLYDGANVIETLDTTGTVLARYTFTENIDEPLAAQHSGSLAFYHADALGSITSMTDGSGNPSVTYRYDAFGNLQPLSGPAPSPYGYTGREYDEETGLYYYRARYYDPRSGRFLQEDPIGYAGGGPNLYAYVANNPLNFVDPAGLQYKDPPGGTAIGPYYDPYGWEWSPWRDPCRRNKLERAVDLTERGIRRGIEWAAEEDWMDDLHELWNGSGHIGPVRLPGPEIAQKIWDRLEQAHLLEHFIIRPLANSEWGAPGAELYPSRTRTGGN
jgi:RHS repeat-associated protein